MFSYLSFLRSTTCLSYVHLPVFLTFAYLSFLCSPTCLPYIRYLSFWSLPICLSYVRLSVFLTFAYLSFLCSSTCLSYVRLPVFRMFAYLSFIRSRTCLSCVRLPDKRSVHETPSTSGPSKPVSSKWRTPGPQRTTSGWPSSCSGGSWWGYFDVCGSPQIAWISCLLEESSQSLWI